MRRVTADAAFGLHWNVLPGKWASFVGMATKAGLVLGGCGTQGAWQKSSVLVMAIAAGYEPFIHAMVERFGEVRFDLKTAGIAQGWLRGPQQLPVHLGRVNGVAVHAPNVVLQVL